MVNPGVITLARKRISGDDCCVEDNIGEAIHLHAGRFRYDMSLAQYRTFTAKVLAAVKEIFPNPELLQELFLRLDPAFLNMISEHIYDIDHVRYEKCQLSRLRCQGDSKMWGQIWTTIPKSRIVKALCGNDYMYKRLPQENHPFQNNMDRLAEILEHMKKNPEAALSKGVVLFNDQNIIRDGQHRASCAYYLFGDIEVPVMRIYFKHPERVNICLPSPWQIFKRFVKRMLRFLRRKLNCVKSAFAKQ